MHLQLESLICISTSMNYFHAYQPYIKGENVKMIKLYFQKQYLTKDQIRYSSRLRGSINGASVK